MEVDIFKDKEANNMYTRNFKLQTTKNQWEEFCRNIYEHMKQDCLNCKVDVLKYINQIYNMSIKELIDNKNDTNNIREFVLYMMVNYSALKIEDIASEFESITLEDLNYLKNDKILEKKYETQIKIFFDQFKDKYMQFIFDYMLKCEDLSKAEFFNNNGE